MSLSLTSHPFFSTPKNFRSPILPLRAHSLSTGPTRSRLWGRRRILKLSASSKLRCSSAMTIEGGPTSSSSSLQDIMLYSRAFWVSKATIAWDVDAGDGSYHLYGSKNATLSVANGKVQGHDAKFKLEKSSEMLPDHVIEKFPHIRDYKSFHVTRALDVKSSLKYQLAVAVLSSGGECTNITGLQLPGVIDELFSYNGPLGTIFSSEAVYLYLPLGTEKVYTFNIFCLQWL